MATRKGGNIISGNIYGRQEVHKYFCTSVNINGRFT